MKNIAKNLKTLRKSRNFSQLDVAERLNIGRSTYKNWEFGSSVPPIDKIELILNLYNVSFRAFIRQDLSLNETKIDKYAIKSKNLFVPVKARASYMNGWDDEAYKEELRPVSIPGIPDDIEARTFEVAGLSMYPLICQGDLLVCLRHEAHDNFSPDEVFVFVTKHHGILVKFIKLRNDSTVRLVSHNAYEFAPMDIEKDDLIEVWKAKYKITRHFSAGTESRQMKSRIERLEDIIREKLG